jgi:hypothetical protein
VETVFTEHLEKHVRTVRYTGEDYSKLKMKNICYLEMSEFLQTDLQDNREHPL